MNHPWLNTPNGFRNTLIILVILKSKFCTTWLVTIILKPNMQYPPTSADLMSIEFLSEKIPFYWLSITENAFHRMEGLKFVFILNRNTYHLHFESSQYILFPIWSRYLVNFFNKFQIGIMNWFFLLTVWNIRCNYE